MSDGAALWVAILVTAAGCYGLKLLGLLAPARLLEHPLAARVSALLPVSLLAALAAVQTFATGTDWSWTPGSPASVRRWWRSRCARRSSSWSGWPPSPPLWSGSGTMESALTRRVCLRGLFPARRPLVLAESLDTSVQRRGARVPRAREPDRGRCRAVRRREGVAGSGVRAGLSRSTRQHS